MRQIGLTEIEDIALGAALLGAGGGGDPYVGKLVAIGAVRECGPVSLLDPEEVPDDALIVPIAMMGAPTVLIEKAIGGNEYMTPVNMYHSLWSEKYTLYVHRSRMREQHAAIARRHGWPCACGCRRHGTSFPELQMVTFTIGGISATPMALTDEKGNCVIFQTITNKWTEELARAVTMSCGGSVSVCLYAIEGKTLKEYAVKNIITRSEMLGRAIRNLKNSTDGTPEDMFFKTTEGFKLFKGKITDVLRETRGAFNFGKVVLEGIGEYKGHDAYVEFQNENLLARVDGDIVATVPDLICLVDIETFVPVTTDALKYGKRVFVVGLKCFDMWRTPKGLELVGPRYFGCDTDFIPVE